AAKPTEGKKRLYGVPKGGVSRWVWANGYSDAVHAVAKADGYTVTTGNSPPVTKQAVAAKLADFTDDELAALGPRRPPQKGGRGGWACAASRRRAAGGGCAEAARPPCGATTWRRGPSCCAPTAAGGWGWARPPRPRRGAEP